MKKAVDLGICGAVVFSGAIAGSVNAACSSTAPTSGASVVCSGTGVGPVAALTGLDRGQYHHRLDRGRRAHACGFAGIVQRRGGEHDHQ
ncbi:MULTISPECIES: hypothetical protein [Burkholderiaceae]|uniref:Lipoprotein n=1 Tax=Caballeronia sordidicola TaxID=196367 RepID=A0A242MYX7_CABSO|nr:MULTISPECIES: hypothetical protein [Burkholderiaceae]OTP76631.1 hypothetical protein PAMC26577_10270 [Caballeronia sordidicola]